MATTRRKKRVQVSEKAADMFEVLAGKSRRARLMSAAPEFRSVRTQLTSLNRALQTAGAPLSCVYLLHGPPGGGKTALALALIRAVQAVGGLSAFVDAELAGDTKRWFRQLGIDPERCLYVGRTDEDEDVQPLTYEEVVEETDGILERFRAGRRDGSIQQGTPLIVVVDSISKMVPKEVLKSLEKKGGDSVRSGLGRVQALLNTAWLAQLGTKVGDMDVMFVVIAHEVESGAMTKWAPSWKVRGGGALIYDSMVQLRVTYAGQVRDLASEGSPMVGKRHRVRVLKNKHGRCNEEAYFYTSMGTGLSPIGFDRIREVVHEAIHRGEMEGPAPDNLTAGSKLEWKGRKFTLKQLYNHPEHSQVVDQIAEDLDGDLVDAS